MPPTQHGIALTCSRAKNWGHWDFRNLSFHLTTRTGLSVHLSLLRSKLVFFPPSCPSGDQGKVFWPPLDISAGKGGSGDARDGVSREVPCSALKGETVPDSLPATPKSPPTRRVPSRGTPRVPSLSEQSRGCRWSPRRHPVNPDLSHVLCI